jgi:hypothetical protein
MSRFFRRDVYEDRRSPAFWIKFSYPFWFTDLLSSLDSHSLLGVSPTEPSNATALDWLLRRQRRDGIWDLEMLRAGDRELPLWLALAICRVLKRFFDCTPCAGKLSRQPGNTLGARTRIHSRGLHVQAGFLHEAFIHTG